MALPPPLPAPSAIPIPASDNEKDNSHINDARWSVTHHTIDAMLFASGAVWGLSKYANEWTLSSINATTTIADYASSSYTSLLSSTNTVMADLPQWMTLSNFNVDKDLNKLKDDSSSGKTFYEPDDKNKNKNKKNDTKNDNIKLSSYSSLDRRMNPDWKWLLRNPYSSTRGKNEITRRKSVDAVRSLLSVVETDMDHPPEDGTTNSCSISEPNVTSVESDDGYGNTASSNYNKEAHNLECGVASSILRNNTNANNNNGTASDAENASRIAEGTIRALRDLALDEAADLQESLRFWTERWERPLLSWLEAGPMVWFSEEGYNHQHVGQKLSQIQAVLSSRCNSIGVLQEHLLRAGWQKGVSQWAVLGQGDQWAAVVGGDGGMRGATFANLKEPHQRLGKSHYFSKNDTIDENVNEGDIEMNNPVLAQWSVDAIRVVREQLHREGCGVAHLPFYENWAEEEYHIRQDSSLHTDDKNGQVILDRERFSLPLWAALDFTSPGGKVVITNLPLMTAEVSKLIDTMEERMEFNKSTTIHKSLKPPTIVRQQWFLYAAGLPFLGYFTYKLVKTDVWALSRHIVFKISSFYAEHVSEPLKSICSELLTGKGREEITDQKARHNAISSLKKMVKNWLDESCPHLTEPERIDISNSMDISLIEKRKEDSVQTAIYEIPDIIKMSLIEMQFIKKELMNAMSAIDELMDSNEINFRFAAMTPAILLLYGVRKMCRFLFYAILKMGKSREEIYASLRHVILDVERLLTMRDDPPSNKTSPPSSSPRNDNFKNFNVLNPDDLGMVILLIHECRTMLYQNQRRFTRKTHKSVLEDLAELAGERGAVSVKQQLTIISRMGRTYPFLKVVSTGVPLDISRFI